MNCGRDSTKRNVNCTPPTSVVVLQFSQMEPTPRSVTWEAPEHHHVEKGNDWFFALGIIVFSLVVVAIFLNNVLLALLIGLAGGALAVSAAQRPLIIPFAVTVRGIKIDNKIYPYSVLESYYIDEEDYRGPQLLVKSSKKIMPLLILPLPVDYIDDIEDILKERLEEEHLEEPFLMKVLELFGF